MEMILQLGQLEGRLDLLLAKEHCQIVEFVRMQSVSVDSPA
jgi:hypothetical protein